MQTVPHFTREPSPSDEIRRMIGDSLLDDWIIRIEYATCGGRSGHCWQQWGEALFALRSPTPAMNAIQACRAAHPRRSVRLNARKVRPETRLVIWVYRGDDRGSPEDQPMPGTDSPASATPASGLPLAARGAMG